MANLTESYQWEDAIHEWGADEFILGGPDGPDNVPPRQLAGRTQHLALQHLIGADLASMGLKEGVKTIRQRMQEGSVLIYNRGVIVGCTASKGAANRRVVLAAGGVFAKGVEIPCAADVNIGITVPSNTGQAALVYYGYLSVGTNGTVPFSMTEAGAPVPAGGIPICRITVPAGNTADNLDGVTLTDVRRYEPGYPMLINSLSYTSVALQYSMIDTDYAVLLDTASYAGGWNQRTGVYGGEKAANGFKIFIDGTLDEVHVQWRAVKFKL